jgi:hypothetical protein
MYNLTENQDGGSITGGCKRSLKISSHSLLDITAALLEEK